MLRVRCGFQLPRFLIFELNRSFLPPLLPPSDGSVRLIDARHPTAPHKTFSGGENHPLRSVALDRGAQHLAAACTDGHLLVWKCGDASASGAASPPAHTARILPLTLAAQNSASIEGGAASVAFRCAFEPTRGALLAVPGETGCQLLRVSADFGVLRSLTAPSSGSTPQTPTLGTHGD